MENKIQNFDNSIQLDDELKVELTIDNNGYVWIDELVAFRLYPNGAKALADFLTEKFKDKKKQESDFLEKYEEIMRILKKYMGEVERDWRSGGEQIKKFTLFKSSPTPILTNNTNPYCYFDLKPKVSFETIYQLEEFRKIQFEYFNDNCEAYPNLALHSFILDTMLKLINQLEMELKNLH